MLFSNYLKTEEITLAPPSLGIPRYLALNVFFITQSTFDLEIKYKRHFE